MLPTVKAFFSRNILAQTPSVDPEDHSKEEVSPFAGERPSVEIANKPLAPQKSQPEKTPGKDPKDSKPKSEKQTITPPEGDVLKNRSEVEILEDGRTSCDQLYEIAKVTATGVIHQQEKINELLVGNQNPKSVSNLLAAWKPDAIKQSKEQPSLLTQQVDSINEVLTTWAELMSEKKQQAITLKEILKKLKTPQWQLPAWLESWVTGTTVHNILTQRQKVFDQARDIFLKSKQPLDRQKKHSLADTLSKIAQGFVNNQIKIFYKDQIVQDYTNNKNNLKERVDGVLRKLFYEDLDKGEAGLYTDQNPVPKDRVSAVKKELIELLRSKYPGVGHISGRMGVSDEQAISSFVEVLVTNKQQRREILDNFMDTIHNGEGPSDRASSFVKQKTLQASLSKLKIVLAQEQTTPQEAPSSQELLADQPSSATPPPELVTAIESVNNLLQQIEQKWILEPMEALIAVYAQPTFVDSLHALGYAWMQKHDEKSKSTNVGVVSATRAGDGERLATIFDNRTGLAKKSMTLILDYAKTIAVPQLTITRDKLYKMSGNTNTPAAKQAAKEAFSDPEVPLAVETKAQEQKQQREKAPESKAPESPEQVLAKKGLTFSEKMLQALGAFEKPAFPEETATPEQKKAFYTNLLKERYEALKLVLGQVPGLITYVKELNAKFGKPSTGASFRPFVQTAGVFKGLFGNFERKRKWITEVQEYINEVVKLVTENKTQFLEDPIKRLALKIQPSNVMGAFQLPADINVEDEAALQKHLTTEYNNALGQLSGKAPESTPESTKDSDEEKTQKIDQSMETLTQAFLKGIEKTVGIKIPDAQHALNLVMQDPQIQTSFKGWKETLTSLAQQPEGLSLDAYQVSAMVEKKAKEYAETKQKALVEAYRAAAASDKQLKAIDDKELQKLALEHFWVEPAEFVKAIKDNKPSTFDPKDDADIAEAKGNKKGDVSLTKGHERADEAKMRETRTSSVNVSLVNRLMSLRKVQRRATTR
jgi:hypothetical protein